MIVGIIVGRIFPGARTGKVLLLSYALSGLLLIASIRLSGQLIIDAIFWFLLGIALSANITIYSAYMQSTTPKEMLGRTASNLYTFRGITATAGTLCVPLPITSYGVDTTFSWPGIILVITSGLIYLALPSIRNLALDKRGESEP